MREVPVADVLAAVGVEIVVETGAIVRVEEVDGYAGLVIMTPFHTVLELHSV